MSFCFVPENADKAMADSARARDAQLYLGERRGERKRERERAHQSIVRVFTCFVKLLRVHAPLLTVPPARDGHFREILLGRADDELSEITRRCPKSVQQ